MYSIAIVDDDSNDIRALKEMLERYFKESGEDYCLAEFHDGSELMLDYSPKYDIVFLDIEISRYRRKEFMDALAKFWGSRG